VTAIITTSKTATAAAFGFPAAVCCFLDIRLYEGKNSIKLGRSKFLRENENHITECTVTQSRRWN
jgi:hypothetical protein